MYRSKRQQMTDRAIKVAMPKVKKLIEAYGLNIVNGCLKRLADYRKNLVELQKVEKRMAELKSKI